MRIEQIPRPVFHDGLAPSVDVRKLRDATARQMAVRFALGAAVSIVAGVISKSVGARFGGLFLAFPAILPASLTFVEDKENRQMADRDATGAILGGLALVVFAAVGESLFHRRNSAVVLALALVAWLVCSFVLYTVMALIRPEGTADPPKR